MTDVKEASGTLSLPEGQIKLIFTDRSRMRDVLESLGIGTILKKESGEPYLSSLPYHISLTHKGDLEIIALSHERVGVDMENVTIPRNVDRLSRLFHESERPTSLYDFYKAWTAKEALGKMRGTGITTELLKEQTQGVRHFDIGEYLVAVAGEGDIVIENYQ